MRSESVLVIFIRLETKWANYEQVEDVLANIGGLNSCMWKNTGMTCD